jgi:hypothetical protein
VSTRTAPCRSCRSTKWSSASTYPDAELASGGPDPLQAAVHQTPHAGCPAKGRDNPPWPSAYLLRAHY